MQHLLPAPAATVAGNRRITAPARHLPAPIELIGQRIYVIRRQKVIDSDHLPYAFTEHGVAMLSSVLNSERAVQMNILIVRAFVKLRDVLATHRDLARKMERLPHTQKDHAAVLSIVVQDIQDLEKKMTRGFQKPRVISRRSPRIGFIAEPR